MKLITFLGLMVENTVVCGKWENNMEKENFIILRLKHGKEEFGMKAKELDGFNLIKITDFFYF